MNKHHWPKTQCYYCGKEAVARCDAAESYNAVMFDGAPRVNMEDPNAVNWCDRPLCENHAEVVGMSTVSGSVDSVDYCPKHITKMKLNESPELKVHA